MPQDQDPIQRIRELTELRDSGAITDDEFRALKATVIGGKPSAPPVQQPVSESSSANPLQTNTRKIVGVGLILGGIAVGLLLYFIIPTGGTRWIAQPGGHYSVEDAQSIYGNDEKCSDPPYTEIDQWPRSVGQPPGIPNAKFAYACFDRAVQRRNIAVGVAFAGIAAGIIVLVTRRRD